MERPSELTPSTTRAIPWWLVATVVIGAVLAAVGGISAIVKPDMLLEPGQSMNDAATLYADYLVSRNIALAIMLLVMLALRARRPLAGLMVFTALVQLFDAVMDIVEGRLALLPILLVYAIAFLIGASWLFGQAFWKAAAWQDNTTPH